MQERITNGIGPFPVPENFYQKEHTAEELYQKDCELSDAFSRAQEEYSTFEHYVGCNGSEKSEYVRFVYEVYRDARKKGNDIPMFTRGLGREDNHESFFKALDELHIDKIAYWDGVKPTRDFRSEANADCAYLQLILHGWSCVGNTIKHGHYPGYFSTWNVNQNYYIYIRGINKDVEKDHQNS